MAAAASSYMRYGAASATYASFRSSFDHPNSTPGYRKRLRGRDQRRGWQRGQYQVPRPAARIFSIGVPQRGHGSPARP